MKKANAFRRFVCEHCMLGPQVNEELDEAEETRMSDAKLTCPASKCYALSSPRQFINGECCEDAKKHRYWHFIFQIFKFSFLERKALVIDAHRAYLNSRLEEDEATLELFDAEKRVSSAKMKLRRAEEELKDAQKEANSTRQNILRRREVTLAKRRKLDEEAATVCREESKFCCQHNFTFSTRGAERRSSCLWTRRHQKLPRRRQILMGTLQIDAILRLS